VHRSTCSVTACDRDELTLDNSVGELIPNVEVKIMSEDGDFEITEHGPASKGELWVRSPSVMKGYWCNPRATAEALTSDGWLKTGDIGWVDTHGRFFIVDHKKDLIKVEGNQVALAELESLLLQHPSILDAAVIGIKTRDGDEKPFAFVVRQPDPVSQQLKTRDVQRFVEDKVVSYKRLAGGVEFVSSIPKNPSGKILRRQLRDEAINARLGKQNRSSL